MSATELKQRLRADLRAAMQARASDDARLLRVLIAALDNAEAVPVEGMQDHSRPPSLSEPIGEVARLELDHATTQALLTKEVEERLSAARDYDGHGRDDLAARLRHEADLIARYLD